MYMNECEGLHLELYHAHEVYVCKYTRDRVCMYLLVIVGACNIEKLVIG